MRLEVGNVWTAVTNNSITEERWLSSYLSFEQGGEGAFQRQAPIHLYDRAQHRFPAGLTSLVYVNGKKKAEGEDPGPGFDVSYTDKRTVPPGDNPGADLEWLRHHPALDYSQTITYQTDAIDRCLEKTRGIISLPTGSGKTEVMCGLFKRLGCTWLIVVPDKQLVLQTAESVERNLKEQCGRIGDSLWSVRRVTVATWQTLSERFQKRDEQAIRLIEQAQGLVVDEAHILPAASIYQIAISTVGAYWRFGFSATPLQRSDSKSVFAMAALGPVIYHIAALELIELGVLAEPHIQIVPCRQHLEGERQMKLPEVRSNLIVHSPHRNRILVNIAKAADKPCWLFIRETAHGRELLSILEEEGLKSVFLFGGTGTDDRIDAIKQQVQGDIEVIVCSSIFNRAINMPQLRSVINGAGGKSVIDSLQRLGRGTRADKSIGKHKFQLFDIDDIGQRWLERHSRARVGAYQEEGYKIHFAPHLGPQLGAGFLQSKEPTAIERYRDDRKREAEINLKLTGDADADKRNRR